MKDLIDQIRNLLQSEGIQTAPSFHLELTDDLNSTPSAAILRPTSYDLSLHLQKYVGKLEQLSTSRFLHPSLEKPALDLRPLFECFNDEKVGVIFIYSPTDGKFLFINKHVKFVLGWTPEKFVKEFPHLLLSGSARWKEFLATIREKKESQFHLVFQSKQGKAESVDCRASLVNKGPFSNNIIGLFAVVTS